MNTDTPEISSNMRSSPITEEQHSYCHVIIKKLKNYRNSGPFLVPVNPTLLGVPDYPQIIKRPMDLGTVEKKLMNHEYEIVTDFEADVRLIFTNCYIYNGENSTISKFAKDMEKIFNESFEKMPLVCTGPASPSQPSPASTSQDSEVKNDSHLTTTQETNVAKPVSASSRTSKKISKPKPEVPLIDINAPRPKRHIRPPPTRDLADISSTRRKTPFKITNNDFIFCRSVLAELKKKQHYPYAFPFYTPVDAESLKIPDYYEIIKEPMDLQTISEKLESNQYQDAGEFEQDIRLIFRNCYTYNPPGTDVYTMGKQLEAVFDKKWKTKPISTAPLATAKTKKRPASTSKRAKQASGDAEGALIALTKTMAALQSQLSRFTNKSKTDESKQKKTSSTKKKSNNKKGLVKQFSARTLNSKNAEPLSEEQKEELDKRISNLDERKLFDLLEFIRGTGAPLEAENGTYELDIEKIDTSIAHDIYSFVIEITSEPQQPPPKKQRVAYNIEETQKQIARLEAQLDKFDKAGEKLAQNYTEYSNYISSSEESSSSGSGSGSYSGSESESEEANQST